MRYQSRGGSSCNSAIAGCFALFCTMFCVLSVSDLAAEEYRVASRVTPEGVVTVHLKAEATCEQAMISLRDIAEVDSTSHNMRDAAGELDIAEFPSDASEVTITRAQVDLRLQLALDRFRRVEVRGPETIRVTRPATAEGVDHLVVSRIQQELATVWNSAAASVRVRLLQPLPAGMFDSRALAQDVQVVVPTSSRPGNLRVKLLVHRDQRLERTQDILVSAELFVDVVVAARNLPRGHVISQADVAIQPQPATRIETSQSVDSVLGQETRISIRENQKIEARYLSRATAASSPLAVKPRDVVRLVAKRGGLTITVANAEVLQSGSIGDDIRVRNPRSKKIVVGKVIGPNIVEMRF